VLPKPIKMKKIFLTGGSGLLGKAFLQRASKNEFEITLGMRKQKKEFDQFHWQHFDLEDQEAVLNLSNFDIVLHSDIKGIRKILEAVKRDQVSHLIYMSIVGVESVPVKYFKTKRKVEELIQAQCANYSILRSTQFFKFFEEEVQSKIKNKISIIPNIKYQPIEVDIVADQLIAICQGNPTNGIAEMGGSEIILFSEAIKTYQTLIGNQSLILTIPNFFLGKLGAALTTSNRMETSTTWKKYLNNFKLKNESKNSH